MAKNINGQTPSVLRAPTTLHPNVVDTPPEELLPPGPRRRVADPLVSQVASIPAAVRRVNYHTATNVGDGARNEMPAVVANLASGPLQKSGGLIILRQAGFSNSPFGCKAWAPRIRRSHSAEVQAPTRLRQLSPVWLESQSLRPIYLPELHQKRKVSPTARIGSRDNGG